MALVGDAKVNFWKVRLKKKKDKEEFFSKVELGVPLIGKNKRMKVCGRDKNSAGGLRKLLGFKDDNCRIA